MYILHRVAIGFFLCLAATGCQTVADAPEPIGAKSVKQADGSWVIPPASPQDAGLDGEVLKFAGLRMNVPRGSQIGSRSIGPVGCDAPGRPSAYGPIYFSSDRFQAANKDFPDAFHKILTGHGFSVEGDPDKLFAEAKDERAVYAIGANVSSMFVNARLRCDFFGNLVGILPAARITVEWQVYSILRREIVWRQQIEGKYETNSTLAADFVLPLTYAFADSANQLAASPGFRKVVMEKPKLPGSRDVARAPGAGTSSAEITPISIPRVPLSNEKQGDGIEQARAASVLVDLGNGHGSGVIISETGLMLTNHHVVGSDRFVNVRLVSGRRVVGEVVRVNEHRDIAIVKLEGSGYKPVPIRTSPLKLTEEVYAIGAPKSQNMGWTVTRGIVSAFRQGYRLSPSERVDLIQSDVEVHPGSSGGPLLDASGNLVGLTVIGFHSSGGATGIGLNGFIPIGDGMDKLKVKLLTEDEIRRGVRSGAIKPD